MFAILLIGTVYTMKLPGIWPTFGAVPNENTTWTQLVSSIQLPKAQNLEYYSCVSPNDWAFTYGKPTANSR
jgi:hypothetical protein